PQALALLNDGFFRDRAADLGRRLLAEGGTKPEDWIDRGFRLTLSRPPGDVERAASVRFLERQLERRGARAPGPAPDELRLRALTGFGQALCASNELFFVDGPASTWWALRAAGAPGAIPGAGRWRPGPAGAGGPAARPAPRRR